MIAHAGLAALLALPAAILLLPQWTPLPASWFTAPALETQATGGSAIDPATATASVPVMLDAAGSTPIIADWSGFAPFLYLVPLVLLCRSEARRVGKECVSTFSSRLSPSH